LNTQIDISVQSVSLSCQFYFCDVCSTLTDKPEVDSQTAVETVEEPEVSDDQLDSDKQLIYQ